MEDPKRTVFRCSVVDDVFNSPAGATAQTVGPGAGPRPLRAHAARMGVIAHANIDGVATATITIACVQEMSTCDTLLIQLTARDFAAIYGKDSCREA